MTNNYKISLTLLIKLSKTKKTFICFNVENNKIKEFVLTNDLIRFRNRYNTFKLVEIIKPKLNKLTIEIWYKNTYILI
jgi:stringent starvation protein B